MPRSNENLVLVRYDLFDKTLKLVVFEYRVNFLKYQQVKFEIAISQLLVDVYRTDFKSLLIQIVLQVAKVTTL